MTIISVDKMWSRMSSTSTQSDLRIETAYQIVTSPDATLYEVYNAPGLPAQGSYNVEDGFPEAVAIEGSVERISPIYYIFRVSWYQTGTETVFGVSNPVYTWSDAESDQVIDQDADGKPIVTATGETINGVTMPIADQVLTIQRKFIGFSPWLVHQYRHSVNSDTFVGYPPGTGRLVSYSATRTAGSDWEVSASIQFRYPYRTTPAKAWYARVRHEGYYVIDPEVDPFKRVRATDVAGEPTIRPVLLKNDGTEEEDAANTIWLEFKRYQSLPYNALGLL